MTAGLLPWRGRTLLITGLVLVTITTILMGVTTHWSMWITWRSIAGVASAWVFVATASLCISRLTRAAAPPQFTGLVFAGVGSGIALAGFVCMALDLRGFHASDTWCVLGAIAAIGTWLTRPLWRISADPVHPPPSPLPSSADLGAWRLIISYGIFGFGYILPATFLPAQARALLQDVALFGWAWPVFGLAAAASTLICGAIPMRLPPRTLWILSQLVMAIGVALPALFPGLTSIVLAALCVGGTFMVITMVGMQQAQLVAGPRARSLIANLTAAFAAGQLAGPIFFSLINEHLGGTLSAALYTGTAVLALGTLLLLKPFAPTSNTAAEINVQ